MGSEQMALDLAFGTLGDCGVCNRICTQILSIFLILSASSEKEYNSISLRQGVKKKKIPSNSSITFLNAVHKNLTFPALYVPICEVTEKASFLLTLPPGNHVRLTMRKGMKLLWKKNVT